MEISETTFHISENKVYSKKHKGKRFGRLPPSRKPLDFSKNKDDKFHA